MGRITVSVLSWLVSWTGLEMRSMCRARDRINLYPAAPFQLATMLNAWIITERWDGANLWGCTLAKRS